MHSFDLETDPILEVRGLTKRFPIGSIFKTRYVHAVESVSFSVRRGQVVALVGESGSGKTTTIRMIARLIQATSGEIRFKSADMLKTEPRQASLQYHRLVQLIFQDPFASLNPVHTIEHHLARPLTIHGKASNRHELSERVCSLLETVDLKPAQEIAHRYPHQLSGGQRQRVAIARALAVDPELILADEPISMLDVSIRMGVLNLIAKLKEQLGIAFVYLGDVGDHRVVQHHGAVHHPAQPVPVGHRGGHQPPGDVRIGDVAQDDRHLRGLPITVARVCATSGSGALRPLSTTWPAPWAASHFAVARPRPRSPPVTM